MGFDILKVSAGIEYLRHRDGEKHVILFSDYGFAPPVRFVNAGLGMRLDSREDDERFAARANDAKVTIDIIHTRGTDGSTLSTIGSSRVSELTGGQFTGARTASDELSRIDEASRGTYVLGYAPANPVLDGQYRQVTVRVSRSNAMVMYRHGYTARRDLPPIDARELMTRIRMTTAAASGIPIDDIKVKLGAARAAANVSRHAVDLDVRIDPAALFLSLEDGKWVGKIDLLILLGDSRQNVVGKLNQTMTLGMSPLLLEQARTSGIPYQTSLVATSSVTSAKVIVYDFGADRVGTATSVVR